MEVAGEKASASRTQMKSHAIEDFRLHFFTSDKKIEINCKLCILTI